MVRAIISASGLGALDLGILTSVSDTVASTLNVTVIPTLDSEDTFILDSGTAETYRLTVSHISGHDGMDNATWLTRLRAYVNRWQAETDGCTLRLQSDNDTLDTQADETVNAYITGLAVSYDAGVPERITATLSLSVGSMFGVGYGTSEPDVETGRMSVMLSDSESESWYYIMDANASCVQSYTIYGGMNQPFEYIEMEIPKNRLASFAPEIAENDDIIAGKNQIIVNAIGTGHFIVTRAKLRDNVYTITGYSLAEAFRGAVTTRVYTETYTPSEIITDILTTGVDVGNLTIAFTADQINFGNQRNTFFDVWHGSVRFPAGSNAWYVLQVCALKMRAKIWFTHDTAYVVDTTFTQGVFDQFIDTIDLYTDTGGFAEDVLGTSELGDEGTSALCTVVDIMYTEGDELATVTVTADNPTLAYYGERGQRTIRVPEIRNREDAESFGHCYIRYLCEVQTSIGFKVREVTADGWHMALQPCSGANQIIDEIDEITITNRDKSLGEREWNLLTQSTYERHYPQGYSQYWYGIQQTNDLTQTVSQILTAIDNN